MNAELIARLEVAEVGSRDFDGEVAAATVGWLEHDGSPITTSIDAVIALAESLFGERNTATMLFIVAGSGDDIKRFPIRLCISILRALDAKQEGA